MVKIRLLNFGGPNIDPLEFGGGLEKEFYETLLKKKKK